MFAPSSICEPTYNSHIDCINYPKFLNFGWEIIYKKYMTNVIRTLDVYHNDISRLYLLIRLDLSCNNLSDTISKLDIEKLSRFPNAMELTNNLKDILPDADPIYLDLVGEVYAFDQNRLCELIEKITTKERSYPKIQEYNERIKILNVINSLTVNFKVDKFLSICPDPATYFKNVKRNSNINHIDESLSYLCDK